LYEHFPKYVTQWKIN